MRKAPKLGLSPFVWRQGQGANRSGPYPHSGVGIGARSIKCRALRSKTAQTQASACQIKRGDRRCRLTALQVAKAESKTISQILGLLGPALLLPWPVGCKGSQKKWKHLQLTDMSAPNHLAELEEAGNIGVALGKVSNGLVTIDFDDEDYVEHFLEANLLLRTTLRTTAHRGCNIWVRCTTDYPQSCKLRSRSGDEIGEWRADGNQTIVAGTHPEGVPYRFVIEKPAITINYREIVWPDVIQRPCATESQRAKGVKETNVVSVGGRGLQIQAFCSADLIAQVAPTDYRQNNTSLFKLDVPIPTGKSWARRGGWKLPKRPGGRPQRTIEASSLNPVADALDATHKELEEGTKTALMQTLYKAAQAVARKDPLDISNMGQFRDACLSAARMFGWDGNAQPSVTYYGDDNRKIMICDEARRQELIAQRERLLAAESPNGRKEAAVTVTLPVQETQSNTNAGAGKGIVAQDQSPVTQKDPLILKMESIAKAETWRSEPENHAGSFGPHPDEYDVW
jgi:hypothetical protein